MPRAYHRFMGLVLGLLVFGGPAKADDAVGQVLTLRGQCAVIADGKAVPLVASSAVHVGDIVDVSLGARLKLQMADGSIISLGSSTRVTIKSYVAGGAGVRRDVRIDLADGLLRAVVAIAVQPSRFEVDTAVGVAAVRSTDWFIEATSGGMRVGVLKGVVTLTDATVHHHMVAIQPRQGARIPGPGLAPTQPRVWKESQFADVIARTDMR